MPLFKIENLSYFYPDAGKPALQDINLEIEEGEFLLVAGGSGSGKSSLARAMAGLIPDFYGGKIGGGLYFKGQDIRSIDRRNLTQNIGIVFQDPEKQLVMTSVETEIAFGMENIGLSQPEMLRRSAEVMSFFALTGLKREFTSNLSGGQKQKVALASILTMQPSVLILDEPTSQLDPLAAEEILNLVKRLNEEMNITIILIEQRLERCFHLADRVAVMENGRIKKCSTPEETAVWEVKNGYPFLPPVAALFSHIEAQDIPLTIKTGRKLLYDIYKQSCQYQAPAAALEQPNLNAKPRKADYKIEPSIRDRTKKKINSKLNKIKEKYHLLFSENRSRGVKSLQENPAAQINNLWYAYPNGREALRDINFSIAAGELVAIMGENGSGKTTLLKQLAGLIKPGRGQITVMNNDVSDMPTQHLARLVGYLSQNPNDYLFHDTVHEELRFTQANTGSIDDDNIEQILIRLDLYPLRHVNPRDLSSGERQRVALGSVLAASPRLLLLDEPTRGLDQRMKSDLSIMLQDLLQTGMAIILVTHDIEFANQCAKRLVMLFDGRIACDGPRNEVLGSSLFYVPQIRRMFKGIDDEIFTLGEAVARVRALWAGRLMAK